MSDANKRQVGGEHYKAPGKVEHWDIVAQHDLDYFQGQITKYVMRWKKKNGVQDLKKAQHFLEKYIELAERPPHDLMYPESPLIKAVGSQDADLERSVARNHGFTVEGWYGDGTQLYKCMKCGAQTRQQRAEAAAAAHGQCKPPPTGDQS